MAGDETARRPPCPAGGRAHPPEPGDPPIPQAASFFSHILYYKLKHHRVASSAPLPAHAPAPAATSLPSAPAPTAKTLIGAPSHIAHAPAAPISSQALAAQAPAEHVLEPAAHALAVQAPATNHAAYAHTPHHGSAPPHSRLHAVQALPQAMSTAPTATTHNPSYAHVALGLTSYCTAEDPHARPCLDSHELKPVGIHDGKPSIRFKKADKQRYLDLMKHVLVGKFSHGRPTIAIIKEFFIALKLKGAYNIPLYDAKHLIIECDLLEDYTRLWELALTPVWVHFPGLPIFLYEEDCLLLVAYSIGKPFRIDALNTNRVKLGIASVCVELDVSKPLVDKVWVVLRMMIIRIIMKSFGSRFSMMKFLIIVANVSIWVILLTIASV
ncbi:hypothetical protein LIER_28293 [Lithospermum erythrorhizon]|uniref:DUF4283 domain-containing protein n=1 Tax=Lithospermum erythrorhizon TaxID=34254 RepID=A0AAV3RI57_LITER